MNKLDMDKPYLITQAQRMDLLKAHNDLKDILQTIIDCQDLWISDVGKLQVIQYNLHRIFKFVPKEDENGHRVFHADWILTEHDQDNEDD